MRVSLLDKKAITCNNYCNIINMHDNIPYEKNKTNIVATCICNHTHPESGSALRKPNTRLIKYETGGQSIIDVYVEQIF